MTDIEILVIDSGMHVSFAQSISKHFGKTWYCVPKFEAFPRRRDFSVGVGVEGINHIYDIFGNTYDKENGYDFNNIELFVITDLYYAPLAEHLRSIGKKVFGSGMAEELELFRAETKELMKDYGLAVNDYIEIEGISKLREHLKTVENKFIKISYFRGEFESLKHINYEQSESWLNELQHALGAIGEISKFIVEDSIPTTIECGIDHYMVNGEYPQKNIMGIEKKDAGYICKVFDYDKLPKEITEVHDKLQPIFKEYGYTGMFSSEIRIGEDKKNYLIDLTLRNASPPSEILGEMITNWDEIYINGADGILIEPVFSHKYAAQIGINSSWASDEFQDIQIDKKAKQWIKLRNFCVINDKIKIIPTGGLTELGYAIGLGDTLREAMDNCKKYAKMVTGYKVTCESDAIDDIEENIKEMEKQLKVEF